MFTSSGVESGNTLSVSSCVGDPLATALSRWRIGLIAFAAMYLAFYIGNSTLVITVFASFWPDELPTMLESALRPTSVAYTSLLPPLAAGFYHWISYSPGKLIDTLLVSSAMEHFHDKDPGELKTRISYAQRLFSVDRQR